MENKVKSNKMYFRIYTDNQCNAAEFAVLEKKYGRFPNVFEVINVFFNKELLGGRHSR